MNTPDHTMSNETISNFLESEGLPEPEVVSIGQALEIICNSTYDVMDAIDVMWWEEAMLYITDQLGVTYDADNEQWVTADEGHPV